jgi:glycosyltransferase involved in cell wall biosynthesis
MRDPRVSVVIPTRDAAPYLRQALASVRAQRYPDLEVIVVDDGSTDDTREIARRAGDVRWLWQDHRGPAAARNRGVEAADGDLIAFLDADDLWHPTKLERQTSRLRADPRLDAATGRVQCVTPGPSGGAPLVNVGPPRLLPLLGALVVRRPVFETVGPLDESLRLGEDLDWFMRARELGVRTEVVDDVVLYYRLHGGSTTYGRAPSEIGYARAVKNLLELRRARATRAGEPG